MVYQTNAGALPWKNALSLTIYSEFVPRVHAMWYCYFDSFSSGQINCYCVPWFTTFGNGDGDGFLLLLRLWHLTNRFVLLLGDGVGVWHKRLHGRRHSHGDGLGTWLRRDRHLESLAWANTVWDRNSHETRRGLYVK